MRPVEAALYGLIISGVLAAILNVMTLLLSR